ncbi:relaxase/mobilization nuclease domain-containing protein [Mucilaginibacter psychrotolerans]|uniref:Relaxase/mobilization nuclease n=1 Tax=Mucilaginibacter psychrotolerans TaxID=1524096 RepID=A0A4Y8SAN4_9SPHI|nr:relaxase/mobilization nuclease domain-containing protein [Mucilaginibacter psychrotolerans]TFF36143.1 relaxase/mobilization nuclease [Mucilaginibacter psychrotolerans]
MIAIEKFGSNFMGALAYNLKKLNHPDRKQRAELLATSFFSLTPGDIRKEVELIRQLRPALGKYVWHTSLNFSNDEKPLNLTNGNLLDIAFDYMKAMGYDDNQYLIVRHHDAGHPHVHLLVNRIRYDGSVVLDSNNYRKSLSVLRNLEEQYNLISLAQDNSGTKQQQDNVTREPGNDITAELYSNRTTGQYNRVTRRSLTKNEIEKTVRTGIPSDKSLLQALLEPIIYERKPTLQEFISRSEQAGISLLFNQARTGRISGITYFINDFKIKGQALGNRFKWAELIKFIDYEQDRDSKAISLANHRTKAKYGAYTTGTGKPGEEQSTSGRRAGVTDSNARTDAAQRDSQYEIPQGNERQPATGPTTDNEPGDQSDQSAGGYKAMEEYSSIDTDSNSYDDTELQSYPGIEIADDIDDEAIHGRNRHKQRKARTNRR